VQRIYFDNNATTPLDESVIAEMRPFLEQHFGNASSLHEEGRRAKFAIESARRQLADLLDVDASQIIFTSGGTESNNLALEQARPLSQLAVSAIEHESVLQKAKQLSAEGLQCVTLPVDEEGTLHMGALQSYLSQGGQFVSVMLANNEIGVLQDVAAISRMVVAAGGVLHTDAVQALGKMPFTFTQTGAHLMSLSAHKINGPKGIGALVFDKAQLNQPLIVGGGHERGFRAGTENVAAIVGFGAAAELLQETLEQRMQQMKQLTEYLITELVQMEGVDVIAPQAHKIPNTIMISIPGVTGEAMVLSLDQQGIAVSSGSACGANRQQPSHVLSAIGLPKEQHQQVLRISVGGQNTLDEVKQFCRIFAGQLGNRAQFADLAW
jgi:cysteine desulfurase